MNRKNNFVIFIVILLYLFQNHRIMPTLSCRPILRPHCISSIDYTVEHRKLTVSAGNFNGPDSDTKAQRDFCTMYKYARRVIARPQGERESRAIRDGRLFNKHALAGSRHGAQGYYTCRSRCQNNVETMVNDVDEFSPVSRLRNVNQPQEKQNTSFPTREVDSFVSQSVYRATSKNFNINETH